MAVAFSFVAGIMNVQPQDIENTMSAVQNGTNGFRGCGRNKEVRSSAFSAAGGSERAFDRRASGVTDIVSIEEKRCVTTNY